MHHYVGDGIKAVPRPALAMGMDDFRFQIRSVFSFWLIPLSFVTNAH